MDSRHPSRVGVSFAKDVRPHRARDCPRREILSALQTARKEEQDSDLDGSTCQLNPLQLVNTFHKPNLVNKLMYVLVQVNGTVVRAMVDT